LNTWLEREGYLKLGPDRKKGFECIQPGSRVFAQVPGRLHLLRQGQWQGGSVGAEECEPLRTEIIEKLRSWTDPANGSPVCRRVMRKEEAFGGPYLDTAPDVVIDPQDGYDLKAAFDGGDLFTHGPISGMHTQWDAMLCVAGRKLAQRRPVVYDVAATALDLLGVATPEDWDGRSLLE
jgi:uncharacterized sulfatase